MAKSKRKRAPKTVLKLPDLEQSKSAVLNSLTSSSSKRSYDHAIREFIDWYCSEPRLAFNRTVVTRYRIALEQHPYAPSTINLRLAAIRRLAYEASDCGLLSPDLAAGIRRVKGVRRRRERRCRPGCIIMSTRGVGLLPAYAQNFLPASVTSRPLKGDVPTVDLVLGYRKSNQSPILKLLLSRVDELVARVSKKIR
jgi:hypothetical protein